MDMHCSTSIYLRPVIAQRACHFDILYVKIDSKMAELCSQKAVLPPSLGGGAMLSIFNQASNGEKIILGQVTDSIPVSGLKMAFVGFAVECAKNRRK
jgi:hypothetical protein